MAKYKVKPNELPSEIAKKYGISPQTLLKANPGVTRFSPGMAIRIPNITGSAGARPGFSIMDALLGRQQPQATQLQMGVSLNEPYRMPGFQGFQQGPYAQVSAPQANLALTNEQRRMQTSTAAPITTASHSPRPPQLPAGWPRYVTNEQVIEAGATPALMYQQGYRFDTRTQQWAFFVVPTPTTSSSAQVINSQNYGYGTSANGRPLDKFGNEILPTNAQGKPKAARNAKGNLLTHGTGRGGGAKVTTEVFESGATNTGITWRT